MEGQRSPQLNQTPPNQTWGCGHPAASQHARCRRHEAAQPLREGRAAARQRSAGIRRRCDTQRTARTFRQQQQGKKNSHPRPPGARHTSVRWDQHARALAVPEEQPHSPGEGTAGAPQPMAATIPTTLTPRGSSPGWLPASWGQSWAPVVGSGKPARPPWTLVHPSSPGTGCTPSLLATGCCPAPNGRGTALAPKPPENRCAAPASYPASRVIPSWCLSGLAIRSQPPALPTALATSSLPPRASITFSVSTAELGREARRLG